MSEILKVSTPTVGQENLNKLKPDIQKPPDMNTAIIDPSKVVKTNSQNIYKEPDGTFSPNFDSNYEKFVELLRTTPSLTESMTELIFMKLGHMVNSGLSEDFVNEISKFFTFMKMSEGDLKTFFKDQASTSVKFGGPFFDLLRQVLRNTDSKDLKSNILEFLRRYDNVTSSDHILNNIFGNLENISRSIPKRYSDQLEDLVQKLMLNSQNSNLDSDFVDDVINAAKNALGLQFDEDGNLFDRDGNPIDKQTLAKELLAKGDSRDSVLQNVQILKDEIIPFLSKYVGATKDFGSSRDIMSLLMLNISRYEHSNKDSFTAVLSSLVKNPEIASRLPDIDVQTLEKILLATKMQNMNTNQMDALLSILRMGIEGDAGYDNRSVFENILKAILLNESVYMPLLHVTIPADVNGMLFFSEAWIDPDYEDYEEESSNKNSDEKASKMFIKFDIKDVGFFEVIILEKENVVDIQLYYPDRLHEFNQTIKGGIEDILLRNGLECGSLIVDRCVSPKPISEVFKKIMERKNAINVTI